MQILKQFCLTVIIITTLFFTTVILNALSIHAEDIPYTVQSGDTLIQIAKRYDVSYKDILYKNFHIVNPSLIYAGDTLIIPVIKMKSKEESLEETLLGLVNQERQKNGLKELKPNEALQKYARIKSKDLSDHQYFAHISPNLGSPLEMLSESDISFQTVGENIALGPTTSESVHTAFMNSEGHAKNVLGDYKEMGIGVYLNQEDMYYWTELFIR